MYIKLLINEKEVLDEADKIIADQLDELNLKARYCYTPTEIGKEYGLAGSDLNSFLKDRQIIVKKQGCYQLTKKYQDRGLEAFRYSLGTDRDGHLRLKAKLVWTEKGRQFITDILKG